MKRLRPVEQVAAEVKVSAAKVAAWRKAFAEATALRKTVKLKRRRV
jgi:hypothetical protein